MQMMVRQSNLLVFAVLIGNCILKQYVTSFCVWRFTVQSNVGYYQITRLSSTDDDIKTLYKKAQLEDAEWLQRVLGERPVSIAASESEALTTSDADDDNSVSEKFSTDEIRSTIPPTKTSRKSPTGEIEMLSSLGYSPADIAVMKESVLRIIMESSINRPRKGLPTSWIDDSNKPLTRSDQDRSSSGRDDVARNRKLTSDNGGEEGRPGSRQGERSRGNRYRENESRPAESVEDNASRFGLDDEKVVAKGSGVGEAFAWSGSPPTVDELENSRRVRKEFRENNPRDSSNFRDQRVNKKIEKKDWDDDKDEDSPSPFWPDVEEFKDMLLDESQWRSGLIGSWSVPLIREETKWRYKLYKNWLKFLDEGLGDGFDVVADEFNEFYDEVDMDMDDRDRDNSAKSSNRDERSAEYQPRDQTDRGQDRERDRVRPLARSSQQTREVEQRRELSKAEKYDAWVSQRVGATGVWTDLEEEEWEAMREQREAAERKRREEALLDFKYDERRRRSSRETEEDRRRSVDFEDDDEDDSRSGGYRNDEAFRTAWKASAERTPSPNHD